MGRPRVADLALARAADPAEIGVLRAYKLLFHNISYANGVTRRPLERSTEVPR